jgi:predicted RNase H-like HicB family nuclease
MLAELRGEWQWITVPLAPKPMARRRRLRLYWETWIWTYGRRERAMKYRVLIEQDEDGFFVAEVPALPGCISQGETRDEALANIREAIAGYLESLKEHQEPIPPSIHEEIVEV